MKSIPVVFMVLFMSSFQFKFSAAACGTCEPNGECVDTTCWCAADKGGDNCATDCGTCTNQVCTGTGTTVSCVACPDPACGVNGACASKAGDATAYCRCVAGWEGTICDADIDECTVGTHDCINGVCVNADGSFSCNCADTGFAGTDCGTDIDECTAGTHNCKNAGVCVNTPGSFTCNCAGTGYTGNDCGTDIDECTAGTHDCKISGVCVNTDGSFTCDCTGTGFTGADCGTVTCDPTDPCDNGQCTPGSGGDPDSCTCNEGFTGIICEVEDHCTPNPCLNEGNCTISAEGYSCDCEVGYTGVNCESGASRMTTALPLMLAALFIFKLIN